MFPTVVFLQDKTDRLLNHWSSASSLGERERLPGDAAATELAARSSELLSHYCCAISFSVDSTMTTTTKRRLFLVVEMEMSVSARRASSSILQRSS